MSKTPKYYIGKYRQIEALEVVLDFQEDNYNLGTAITYILRAGKKPNNPITQDIQKAIAHLQKELEHQTHISSNTLEYFEFQNSSTPNPNGMALLHKQSDQEKGWPSAFWVCKTLRQLRPYSSSPSRGSEEGARVLISNLWPWPPLRGTLRL